MNDIKIFLIGMMGAGKTSVGLTLSRVLGFPFFDTDELIGVDSYFNNHTIDEFRLEEIKQINKISNQNDRAVISIGGGAILSSENREIINQNSSFFLKASIDKLISRIKKQGTDRPLINFLKNGDIDKSKFVKLYMQRENYYLDLANFVVDTDNQSILNVTMEIKELLFENEIIN
tara:strand:+ start:1574 stop:2098 length:525 start_codon:yes stop_codon:yes gene_type:complete